MALNLTDENFEKEISEAKLPVLVDFFADWCGPCKILGPVLDKIGEDFKEKIVFAKVDVGQAPNASGKFGVEKIPTVMLFKNSKPVGGFVGMADENDIKKWLSENL